MKSWATQVQSYAMLGYDHLVHYVRDSAAGEGENWANEWEEERGREEEKGREKEKMKKKSRRARA